MRCISSSDRADETRAEMLQLPQLKLRLIVYGSVLKLGLFSTTSLYNEDNIVDTIIAIHLL